MLKTRVEPAVELVTAGSGDSRILLTCEHASEHAPRPFEWHPDDAWLRGTHWSHDIGAAELVRDLCAAWEANGVLARFSRLLVDPNRPLGHDELFRKIAEGRSVRWNEELGSQDRELRLSRLYHPYHDAIDVRIRETSAEVIFAIHSFTPVYEGTPRHLEIGILFDREEALAEQMQRWLRDAGFETELNEPYSGKEGLIFSADRHGDLAGIPAIEIEVRQDLIVDDVFRRRLVDALAPLRG